MIFNEYCGRGRWDTDGLFAGRAFASLSSVFILNRDRLSAMRAAEANHVTLALNAFYYRQLAEMQ
jgi:hypothetical protein